MSSLLRKKIFLGYIIITAIVLFLTVVMVNERFRFRRFEGVINETNYARENIHRAHLYITRLATLGESVIAWDESDYNRYHYQRLKTDSILLVHDRIIGKHLHGLYPGTVNGFIFRRRHRVQFRQLDLEGYRNVRILAYDAVVFHGQNRESVFQITGLQYTSHFFLFFLVNALNILRRADR